ncbi:MAG: dihydrodipicolinate reductase [Novosphingobium sp.]|nr:dihydrodipicolinate reductase [Novosphingobium sp.]MCP5404317.1 dihydrodipicolinate reductase [Novosphingobium sp.]
MEKAEAGDGRRLRVVQWATGYVGTHTLKKVIEHPGLDLVGLYVFSESKEGKDAGELCGLPPTGVKATRDIEEIVALKPDCVLYMQEGIDFDDICRLLESGANVVTTRAEFHYGAKLDPEIRAKVEEACRKGNSSIHATGSSPGFITEAIPIVLTSIQRRVDSITIDEFANMVDGCSPFMLFETMGYGKPPSTFDENRLGMVHNGFRQSLELLGDALGKPIEEIVASAETACASKPIEVPGEGGGTIAPGTLAAERVTLRAMHKGEPYITFRANWYCSKDIDADWPLRDVGWRVQVAGDCPLDVEIHFPIAKEDMAATLAGYTAHRPVNAIRAVVEAPAGMVSAMDLPQIVADVGE